jgi:hypothetical protein
MTALNKTGEVNASALNMRASPGGKILRVLPRNTEIEIIEAAGDWLKVQFAGQTGFVSSQYVRIEPDVGIEREVRIEPEVRIESETKRSPVSGTETGFVNVDFLNFRKEPDGTVLDILAEGTALKILGISGEWLCVSVRGLTGYVKKEYVDIREPEKLPPPVEPSTIAGFHFEGDSAAAPDGVHFGRRFKGGLFNNGQTGISDFINKNSTRFLDCSGSLLRVMAAVSQNEGKYEAFNTWDNAFLSFGIFQWTSGVGSAAGELPALIHQLRERYPETFQQYFGAYNLGITPIQAASAFPANGYFTLSGTSLIVPAAKAALRSLPWAYRFWLSGQDDNVREIQTRHAMERIHLFYHNDHRKIGNFFVSDYVTSEYGLALMLDEHVNRPGHVPLIMSNAVKLLRGQVAVDEPQSWGDNEERLLLQKYLNLRARSTMTDSKQRADNIANYVKKDRLSDKRHSFS